jgi:hypothetical protein
MTIQGPDRRTTLAATLAFALLSLVSACRRDEITHFRVKKAPDATFAKAQPSGVVQDGLPPPPVPPPATSALRWTLPNGWTEGASGGMRYATLKPSIPGRIDVSVIVLPGDAGGELANVNRWRGQLGLSAIDERALAATRKAIRTKVGTVSVYDFSSEGEKKSRLVAALAVVDGNTWFVKMLGDAGPVGASRSDFILLLRSLHLDGAN